MKPKVISMCPYGDWSYMEWWKQNILKQDPETIPTVNRMWLSIICVSFTEAFGLVSYNSA